METGVSNLQKIVRVSRFVTLAKEENGIVIEANCWLNDKTYDPPYTVNIRGYGSNLQKASEQTLYKMKLCGVKL